MSWINQPTLNVHMTAWRGFICHKCISYTDSSEIPDLLSFMVTFALVRIESSNIWSKSHEFLLVYTDVIFFTWRKRWQSAVTVHSCSTTCMHPACLPTRLGYGRQWKCKPDLGVAFWRLKYHTKPNFPAQWKWGFITHSEDWCHRIGMLWYAMKTGIR